MRTTFIIIAVLAITGCNTLDTVTMNRLDWSNPEGANLNVEGHKDTIIEDLEITLPDKTVIKMAKYTSSANAGAVEQAGAIEQALTAAIKALAEKGIDKVIP